MRKNEKTIVGKRTDSNICHLQKKQDNKSIKTTYNTYIHTHNTLYTIRYTYTHYTLLKTLPLK